MLFEFDRRFNDNFDVLRAASVFNPSCEEAFLDPKHISTITTHYSKVRINTDTVDAQLAMAKSLSYCQCQPSRPKDIFAFRDILSSIPDAFTDLLKLVHCFDTSGDNSLKRANVLNSWSLKTISERGDERHSDLLVLSCLSEDAIRKTSICVTWSRTFLD